MTALALGALGDRVRRQQPLLPNGARVAWIGDSVLQFNHQNSSATNAALASQSKGEVVSAQMLDPRFRCDVWISADSRGSRFFSGANQGLTGDTASSPGPAGDPSGMATRVSTDILPLKPDVCIVSGGTNDVAAANNMPGLQTVCTTLMQNFIRPVLTTVRPWPSTYPGHSSADQGSMLLLNTQIRAYVAATPGVTLCDLAAAYGCPGPDWSYGPTAYYNNDDLHPSQQGGYIGGQAIAASLATIIQPGNWYLNTFWGSGTNLLPPAQAIFNGGSAGGKAYQTTGSVPTGCNIYSNTASTNAVSLLANGATGGSSVQMLITPAGTASYEMWPLTVATAPTAMPGSYVIGLAEIEFDAWAFWGGATFQLSETPNSANQTSYGMAVGTPTPTIGQAGRLWLITPALKLDSAASGASPQITVFTLPAGATGTGTFKIHRWGVFPIPDPHGPWNS